MHTNVRCLFREKERKKKKKKKKKGEGGYDDSMSWQFNGRGCNGEIFLRPFLRLSEHSMMDGMHACMRACFGLKT